MAIIKLKRPLKLGTGDSVYPMTSADQIIKANGEKLEVNGKINIDIVNIVYPIGSIYMSINNANPATLFGGTWERIQDRFLLAAGNSYTAGSSGGEATHTLTASEMPAHTHAKGTMNITGKFVSGSNYNVSTDVSNFITGAFSVTDVYGTGENASSGSYDAIRTISFNAANTWTGETSSVGNSSAHNNMPPYLAVYIWKRTA